VCISLSREAWICSTGSVSSGIVDFFVLLGQSTVDFLLKLLKLVDFHFRLGLFFLELLLDSVKNLALRLSARLAAASLQLAAEKFVQAVNGRDKQFLN